MDLSLSNVINISVAAAQTGVGQYNTSNLALMTSEVAADSFGSLGYKIYLDPSECATDFGSDSETFAMANAIFSQQPNILGGGGYLVVVLMDPEIQDVGFSATAASGTFVLNWGGHATAAINWNDSASVIQGKLRAVEDLSAVTVTGSISAGLVVTFVGVYGDIALLTVTSNSLETSGSASITVTPSQATAGETLGACITRTQGLVQYFGIIATNLITQTDGLAAAAVTQALNKMLFLVSATAADVAPNGYLDLLQQGDFTHSRGLYYGGTVTDPLVMAASYASRGLSVDFTGSNTTLNMNLKDLSGVLPDDSMNQTLLNQCVAAGADTYVSFQGVAKVYCSGINSFFDQVYNLLWFVGALQVAGFNYLAESSTKIPQTENGIDGLKGAYRNVCEEAVSNQYSAPGQWNSSTTFGNQVDFIANIAQRGYYIYSTPISQQSQTDRSARKAPLIQIALKEAGAVDSSNVIVNINA